MRDLGKCGKATAVPASLGKRAMSFQQSAAFSARIEQRSRRFWSSKSGAVDLGSA